MVVVSSVAAGSGRMNSGFFWEAAAAGFFLVVETTTPSARDDAVLLLLLKSATAALLLLCNAGCSSSSGTSGLLAVRNVAKGAALLVARSRRGGRLAQHAAARRDVLVHGSAALAQGRHDVCGAYNSSNVSFCFSGGSGRWRLSLEGSGNSSSDNSKRCSLLCVWFLCELHRRLPEWENCAPADI